MASIPIWHPSSFAVRPRLHFVVSALHPEGKWYPCVCRSLFLSDCPCSSLVVGRQPQTYIMASNSGGPQFISRSSSVSGVYSCSTCPRPHRLLKIPLPYLFLPIPPPFLFLPIAPLRHLPCRLHLSVALLMIHCNPNPRPLNTLGLLSMAVNRLRQAKWRKTLRKTPRSLPTTYRPFPRTSQGTPSSTATG